MQPDVGPSPRGGSPMEELTARRLRLRRGATSESLVGLAAVVLSVLGLIGLAPAFLCAIAAICVGIAFMVGSGSTLLGESTTTTAARQVDAAPRAGVEWLAALAGVVIGALALFGVNRPLLLG